MRTLNGGEDFSGGDSEESRKLTNFHQPSFGITGIIIAGDSLISDKLASSFNARFQEHFRWAFWSAFLEPPIGVLRVQMISRLNACQRRDVVRKQGKHG